jgi:hypothetical protein
MTYVLLNNYTPLLHFNCLYRDAGCPLFMVAMLFISVILFPLSFSCRRKVDSYLMDWKSNPDRKPLIIKGARQIGKTRSIEWFASHNYKNIIQINFS